MPTPNKRIVVTGATKGIGLAIAQSFAQAGFDLAICSRSAQDLQNIKSDISSNYPNIQIHTLPADLSVKEQTLRFAAFVKEKWNTIDVLVNNAGLFIPGKIAEEEEGALEKMIATNLYSAYHLTRALLPAMYNIKKAHIFNMCSVASIMAYPNGGSYSISKFALLGFSKVLREELKDKGIRVTSILPGATWSNSWAGVDLPQSRLMEANDIAISVRSAYNMSPSAVVEEIIIRPQLGDL